MDSIMHIHHGFKYIMPIFILIACAHQDNPAHKRPKTNFDKYNVITVPRGCEEGPCSSQLLKDAFYQDQKIAAPLNNPKIPKKDNSLRIATFNAGIRSSLKDAFLAIKSIDADIIAFQEINDVNIKSINDITSAPLYAASCKTSENIFNLIVSKYPITHIQELALGQDGLPTRCAVMAHIDTTWEKVDVIATHLDVFDATGAARLAQINTIGNTFIGPWNLNNSQGLIMLGDFNALKKNELNKKRLNYILAADKARNIMTPFNEIPLVESFGMVDSFVDLDVEPPQSTVWSGRRVDYIFSSYKGNLKPHGCYIYHTTASDHLPLFCDFKI